MKRTFAACGVGVAGRRSYRGDPQFLCVTWNRPAVVGQVMIDTCRGRSFIDKPDRPGRPSFGWSRRFDSGLPFRKLFFAFPWRLRKRQDRYAKRSLCHCRGSVRIFRLGFVGYGQPAPESSVLSWGLPRRSAALGAKTKQPARPASRRAADDHRMPPTGSCSAPANRCICITIVP